MEERTGIEVTATHPMLLFLFFFPWAPRVVVDGVEHKARWYATTLVPAPPGEHAVEVHYRVQWLLRRGQASTVVTVPEHGRVALRYRSPVFFAVGQGSLLPA